MRLEPSPIRIRCRDRLKFLLDAEHSWCPAARADFDYACAVDSPQLLSDSVSGLGAVSETAYHLFGRSDQPPDS